MKKGKWIELLLAAVITAALCWGVAAQELPMSGPLQGPVDFAQMPPGPPPLLEEGPEALLETAVELKPRLAEGLPQLGQVVRDIAALRAINHADLSAQQIEKILPILRKLAQEQDALVHRMVETLAAERTRLLKEKGPSPRPAGAPGIREEIQRFRTERLEEAKGELSKHISAPQLEVLARLITPPHIGGAMGLPRGGGPLMGHRVAPQPGMPPQGASAPGVGGGGMGQGSASPSGMPPYPGQRTGRGMMGQLRPPLLDLDRLVDLLQEKLAAMREGK